MEITKATPIEEINCGFQFIIDLIQDMYGHINKHPIKEEDLHHLAEEVGKVQESFNGFVKTEIINKDNLK